MPALQITLALRFGLSLEELGLPLEGALPPQPEQPLLLAGSFHSSLIPHWHKDSKPFRNSVPAALVAAWLKRRAWC